jgi:hypothetical protein
MSRVRDSRPDRPTIIAAAALAVAIVGTVVAVSGFANAAPGTTVVRKVVIRRGMVHRGEIAPGAVTTKALAPGAVTTKKIHKEAIIGPKLAKASVGPETIAPDAVTAGAIAPGSVYGGALGQESVVTKPISDLDPLVDKTWTPSNIETVECEEGQPVLGGGIGFTNPGDGEAAVLQLTPYLNGPKKGFMGRITSNAGGAASGEVMAICLK